MMQKKLRVDHWILFTSVLLVIVLAIGAFLTWWIFLREEPQPENEIHLYEPVQAILKDEDNRKINLGEQSEPTILLFWSSWCEDCRDYLRNDFKTVYGLIEAAGVRLKLVCRDGIRGDNRNRALQELESLELPYGTWIDPKASLYKRLSLKGVPSMALIDKDGKLVYTTEQMPDPAQAEAMCDFLLNGGEQQTLGFLMGRLADGNGNIVSQFTVSGDAIEKTYSVLSETNGLLMQYAVCAGNRELFDRLLQQAESMSLNGLTAWKSEDGRTSNVNAALDDLRILDAIREANEQWGSYDDTLKIRANAWLDRMAPDQIPVDYAELEGEGRGTDTTLCYLDIRALRKLSELNSGFAGIAERAEMILRGGLISTAFPLYFRVFSSETGSYGGINLQMNEAMVTVLNAVRAGIAEEDTLNYLQQLLDSPVYACYKPDGSVCEGYDYESTATYALLVQIGIEAGYPQIVRKALERMESNRCFTEPMIGAYGRVTDEVLYTFDTAEALLALQKLNNYTMPDGQES